MYISYDPNGRITGQYTDTPDSSLTYIAGSYDPEAYYVSGTTAVPRPAHGITLPTILPNVAFTLNLNPTDNLNITRIDETAEFEVLDAVSPDGIFILTLPNGEYTITITKPFPIQEFRSTIVI